MKNIHLSELMENREPVSFTTDASLKDLLISVMKNWKIHKFYITDENNLLKGTITKNQILEYLSPFIVRWKIDFTQNWRKNYRN
jgi:predicted transcriptional regulator